MAKKTYGKTSKKATINFEWDNNKKPNKKTSKKVNKAMKKVSFAVICGAILLLAVGAVGGFFGVKFLTRNDCFQLIGKDEITLQLNETYTDEGAKIVAFGKDVSEDVVIETNLKQNNNGEFYAEEEGTYYIVYKSKSFKYNSVFKVQKIRLVTFVEATEQEEIENVGGNA
ncbi:MAG: hypothetical protein IKY10_04490 [Clostridia bacterium]|nr:hypothetical protein [Clostridia bacterium]